MSDNEAFALSAIQADKALEEFMSARSDNQSKKRDMYRRITRDGFVELKDLPNNPKDQTTLNTLNTYLLASGIRSDLVSSSLKTIYTIEKQAKR